MGGKTAKFSRKKSAPLQMCSPVIPHELKFSHGEEPATNSKSQAGEFSSRIQTAQSRVFLLHSFLSKMKCAFVEAKE